MAWDVTGKGKTVIRSGFGMFFDAFSQDMVMGHLPYPPYFAPGPAYNPVGPAQYQIIPATGNGNPIAAGQPVYGAPSCLQSTNATRLPSTATSRLRTWRTTTSTSSSSLISQASCKSATSDRKVIGCGDSSIINQPSQANINACDQGLLPGCGLGIQDYGSAARPYGAMASATRTVPTTCMQENSLANPTTTPCRSVSASWRGTASPRS